MNSSGLRFSRESQIVESVDRGLLLDFKVSISSRVCPWDHYLEANYIR